MDVKGGEEEKLRPIRPRVQDSRGDVGLSGYRRGRLKGFDGTDWRAGNGRKGDRCRLWSDDGRGGAVVSIFLVVLLLDHGEVRFGLEGDHTAVLGVYSLTGIAVAHSRGVGSNVGPWCRDEIQLIVGTSGDSGNNTLNMLHTLKYTNFLKRHLPCHRLGLACLEGVHQILSELEGVF